MKIVGPFLKFVLLDMTDSFAIVADAFMFRKSDQAEGVDFYKLITKGKLPFVSYIV